MFFRAILGCAVTIVVQAGQCQSALVTYGFTGHVINSDLTGQQFSIGSQFQGRFSYDTALALGEIREGLFGASSQLAPPDALHFQIAFAGVPFTFEPYEAFAGGLANDLEDDVVHSFDGFPKFDGLLFGSSYTGPELGWYPAADVVLTLLDPSHSYFPLGNEPTFGEFDPVDFFNFCVSQDGVTEIRIWPGGLIMGSPAPSLRGTIDSVYLVPEPSTLALGLSAALLSAIAAQRRGRRFICRFRAPHWRRPCARFRPKPFSAFGLRFVRDFSGRALTHACERLESVASQILRLSFI